jgi:HAD superfamily hydrolase (TIGR01549 family)
MTPTTVILDLDGTLVDSVYVHTLAWRAAFRDVGLDVASHRLHRLIGMGGDRLVTAAAGQAAEDAVGDRVRELHKAHLDDLFGQVTAADGAVELLTGLRDHGFDVVLASSGDRDDTDRLLDLLGEGRAVLDAVITGSDAEQSKPDGELLEVALRSIDSDTALVVGDAVWDVAAARDAGVPCLGVLTGGFSEAELREAGAVDVVDSARTLAERLDEGGALL